MPRPTLGGANPTTNWVRTSGHSRTTTIASSWNPHPCSTNGVASPTMIWASIIWPSRTWSELQYWTQLMLGPTPGKATPTTSWTISRKVMRLGPRPVGSTDSIARNMRKGPLSKFQGPAVSTRFYDRATTSHESTNYVDYLSDSRAYSDDSCPGGFRHRGLRPVTLPSRFRVGSMMPPRGKYPLRAPVHGLADLPVHKYAPRQHF